MWGPQCVTDMWVFITCVVFIVLRLIHGRFLSNTVQFIITHPWGYRMLRSLLKHSKIFLEILFICSFRGSRTSLIRLKIRVSCHSYFHKSVPTTPVCAHFFNPNFFDRISVHYSLISIVTFKAVPLLNVLDVSWFHACVLISWPSRTSWFRLIHPNISKWKSNY